MLATTFIANNTLIALCQTATNKKEKNMLNPIYGDVYSEAKESKLVQLTRAHEAVNYTIS